jgi:L-seryl-tRNA(Ser) seleniumtransferase
MMAISADELRERAARFCDRLMPTTAESLHAVIEDGESVIGGGSAPEVKLPTALVAIHQDGVSAAALAERLRSHRTPIIARTERDRVLIDLRTVAADEESLIIEALTATAQPVPLPLASVQA